LAKMIEERDALAQKVEKLKNDGMKATIAETKGTERKDATVTKADDETKKKDAEEDEEYEVVYVTEEELAEGEEYEVEYVDEEEVAEAIKELEDLDKENEKIPLIPHFKKSESVATVPAEKVAQMATAITTEKKYSGLIGRAVKQREQAEIDETVTMVDEEDVVISKQDRPESKKPERDADIRTDKDGKEYVQATMTFDDNYEITDF